MRAATGVSTSSTRVQNYGIPVVGEIRCRCETAKIPSSPRLPTFEIGNGMELAVSSRPTISIYPQKFFYRSIFELTGALIRARHERRLRRSCVCQSSEFQGQFGKWGISASSVNPKSRCQTKSPLPDAQLQFYTRINPSLPLLLPLSLCLI